MLEKSISEHANNRDGRLKDLEKKIKANKAQVQSASKDLKVGVEIAAFIILIPSKPYACILHVMKTFTVDGKGVL